MRNTMLVSMTTRFYIEATATQYRRSKNFVLHDRNGGHKVGELLDVNCDGNFRFFTSFYSGYIDFIVLLNEKDVIREVQNGKQDVILNLQIRENVQSVCSWPQTSPRRDNKDPDIIFKGNV